MNCDHKWKNYIGLGTQESFNYCDLCGIKESKWLESQNCDEDYLESGWQHPLNQPRIEILEFIDIPDQYRYSVGRASHKIDPKTHITINKDSPDYKLNRTYVSSDEYVQVESDDKGILVTSTVSGGGGGGSGRTKEELNNYWVGNARSVPLGGDQSSLRFKTSDTYQIPTEPSKPQLAYIFGAGGGTALIDSKKSVFTTTYLSVEDFVSYITGEILLPKKTYKIRASKNIHILETYDLMKFKLPTSQIFTPGDHIYTLPEGVVKIKVHMPSDCSFEPIEE